MCCLPHAEDRATARRYEREGAHIQIHHAERYRVVESAESLRHLPREQAEKLGS